ncbi:hypothetical protein [uncultured Comamonas sp.]|uniref:hypothetical protein n=1 Tax=uncultured Comamonas sp. TaxID=114710 RepID=UPI00374A0467
MHFSYPALWRIAATLLKLLVYAVGSTSTRAEDLEGLLERGARYSVLSFGSRGSGDLIG